MARTGKETGQARDPNLGVIADPMAFLEFGSTVDQTA
jgi:hypothetical protein